MLKRGKLIKINYFYRSFEPGFVSTFKLVPFSNKLLALTHFTSGSSSYLPAITSTKIFSFVTFKFPSTSKTRLKIYEYATLIKSAPKFRQLSNLELWPGKGIQYARSEGSSAIITKINKLNHTAFVKLPSGVKKFFSIYAVTLLKPSSLKLKRKLKNTKSGFYRSFGLKNQVRGVAMNPVDHPHGGRTKSIKYPRTP